MSSKLHGATPTWALKNHDIVRSATRFGGGYVVAQRARAALVTRALELRQIVKERGSSSRTTAAPVASKPATLICERSADFFVAVAMGTEPVQLPAGTVLLSAGPLAEDGRLQPNNAGWVLKGQVTGAVGNSYAQGRKRRWERESISRCTRTSTDQRAHLLSCSCTVVASPVGCGNPCAAAWNPGTM